MRSVATYGSTVEQLFMPKKMTAINIDPSMLIKSCSLFLQKKEKTCYTIGRYYALGKKKMENYVCMLEPFYYLT